MRSMPCSDEGQGWISKTRKKIIAEQLPHSMVKNEIRSVIMLIALNFPCPSWVRISTTQLAKYPHVSYVEECILNLFPCLLLEQKIITAKVCFWKIFKRIANRPMIKLLKRFLSTYYVLFILMYIFLSVFSPIPTKV